MFLMFLQLQELEMENAKLRNDLQTLRKAVADSSDLEGSGIKGNAAKKYMGKTGYKLSLSFCS